VLFRFCVSFSGCSGFNVLATRGFQLPLHIHFVIPRNVLCVFFFFSPTPSLGPRRAKSRERACRRRRHGPLRDPRNFWAFFWGELLCFNTRPSSNYRMRARLGCQCHPGLLSGARTGVQETARELLTEPFWKNTPKKKRREHQQRNAFLAEP
jgi:hypothetical protein